MDEIISVIIPAYNCEDTIVECLNSVFEQTYISVEIIVIDDGSTDNTRSFIEQFDTRVNLVCQEKQGVSAARNLGVSIASGKWIAFLDSDDNWLPDKLKQQLASIGTHCWSHTDSFYIGYMQDGSTTRSDLTEQFDGDVIEQLMMDNFLTTSTVMIRKDVFIAFGGFDTTMDTLEDWDLWLRLANNFPIAYVATPLAEYRILIGSASRNARTILPVHIRLINTAIQAKYKEYSLEKLTHIRRRAESKSYNVCSYIAEQSGDYSFALYCSFWAATRQPINLNRLKRVARCLINILR